MKKHGIWWFEICNDFFFFCKNGIPGVWSWNLFEVEISDEYWLYDNLESIIDLLKFEFVVDICDFS